MYNVSHQFWSRVAGNCGGNSSELLLSRNPSLLCMPTTSEMLTAHFHILEHLLLNLNKSVHDNEDPVKCLGERRPSKHPLMFCPSYFLKVNDSNCDHELLSLLLDAKLLAKCISTPFYPHIIEHLLASLQQGRWDAEELAKHLQQAGHQAEAGSLLLAVRGTHPALRTFSTALSAAQHWV